MKKLISLIVLLFSVNQLYAQDLYPIIKEAFKHVNIYSYSSYNYSNDENMKEIIDTSIRFRKSSKKYYKYMSNVLFSSGFKFNNANDTILISTDHSDSFIDNLPNLILARSSKSLKILYNSDNLNRYKDDDLNTYKDGWEDFNINSFMVSPYRINKYAFKIFQKDISPEKYTENYFQIMFPKDTEIFKKLYFTYYYKPTKYYQNFYYMMYKGDIEAFKELYIKEIGIVLGKRDNVIRIVIKDGKVVSPTMIWSY